MSSANRFVIEDLPAERSAGDGRLGARASRVIGWLQIAELALLVPWRAVAVILLFLAPLLLLLALPFVLLGALLVLQAPVFYVMWRLAGGLRERETQT